MEFGKTCFKNVYYVGTDVHIKHMYINTKSKLLTVVTSAEQEERYGKEESRKRETKNAADRMKALAFHLIYNFFFS